MPYAPDSYPRQIPQFKVHGRGEVTVSAKGIITGDSNIPNNGADFGPDTMGGATTTGQHGAPYTATSGIGEACNYIHSLGGGIVLFQNVGKIYSVTNSMTIYQDTTIDGSFSTINFSPSTDSVLFSIAELSNPNHIIKNLTVNLSSAPSGGITTVLIGTTMNKLPEYENIVINANSKAKNGFAFGNGSNTGCKDCVVNNVTKYAYNVSGGGTGVLSD